MSATKLANILSEENGGLPGPLSPESIDRVLTEPAQATLAEAVAADLVDAAPLVGDLLALVRLQNAEEEGVEYPSRPAFVENAISDLPPPFDTAGDLIISQNVLHHLEDEQGIPVAALPDEITADTAGDVDNFIEGVLPDIGTNDASNA